MARTTRLTVQTEVGTFTRETARTYTHLVVARGYRAEVVEARRLETIASERKLADGYRNVVALGHDPSDRTEFSRQCTAENLANGDYLRWIAAAEATVARLEAHGSVVRDLDGWDLTVENLASEATTWRVVGWCGRRDLADKLVASRDCQILVDVRVFAVADGSRVR